jgi:hypothetical protein
MQWKCFSLQSKRKEKVLPLNVNLLVGVISALLLGHHGWWIVAFSWSFVWMILHLPYHTDTWSWELLLSDFGAYGTCIQSYCGFWWWSCAAAKCSKQDKKPANYWYVLVYNRYFIWTRTDMMELYQASTLLYNPGNANRRSRSWDINIATTQLLSSSF